MTGGQVTREVTAELVNPRWWPVEVPGAGLLHAAGIPAQVVLTWDPAHPFEVQFEFYNGRQWVPWLVDRELVALGLIEPVEHLVEPFEDQRRPAGLGDVRFEPCADAVLMTLDSPSGHARFLFAPDGLATFLRETYRHTPLGAEQVAVDWDQLLLEPDTWGAA